MHDSIFHIYDLTSHELKWVLVQKDKGRESLYLRHYFKRSSRVFL